MSSPENSGSEKDSSLNPKELVETLEAIVQKARSSEPQERVEALFKAESFITDHLSVEILTKTELLPALLECLQKDDHTTQLRAAKLVTAISCGETDETKQLVTCGMLPVLIKLLGTPHGELLEEALFGLSNIAGNDTECRDLVISEGIVPVMVELYYKEIRVSAKCKVMWVMNNLCANPQPPLDIIKLMLPCILNQVENHDHFSGIDHFSALITLSQESQEVVEAVLEMDMVTKLVIQLKACSGKSVRWVYDIQYASLQILSNILKQDQKYVKNVLNTEVLSCLPELLQYRGWTKIVTESLSLLSYVMSEMEDHVQKVVDADLLPLIIKSLQHRKLKVRKMAAVALRNFTKVGNPKQVLLVANTGSWMLSTMMLSRHVPIITAAVEILDNLLTKTDEEHTKLLLDRHVVETLKSLQLHDSLDVYDSVSSLYEHHGALIEGGT